MLADPTLDVFSARIDDHFTTWFSEFSTDMRFEVYVNMDAPIIESWGTWIAEYNERGFGRKVRVYSGYDYAEAEEIAKAIAACI